MFRFTRGFVFGLLAWAVVLAVIFACSRADADTLELDLNELQTGRAFDMDFVYESDGSIVSAFGTWAFGASNSGLYFDDDDVDGFVDPQTMSFDIQIDRSSCCWSVDPENLSQIALRSAQLGITDFQFDELRLWMTEGGADLNYEITNYEWPIVDGKRTKTVSNLSGSVSGHQVAFAVSEPASAQSILAGLLAFGTIAMVGRGRA